ncbi:MAG: NUDIX hydrolase [Terriglobia bacterium]|nr:MAG: NUDIX hydrolase [Terriglobia bacterium]
MKEEVVFSTQWFDVLAKSVNPLEEPYYSLRLPDYAAVVALTDDQRVLLVRQYRPAVERHTLELPSGIVDPGETPAEAAARELLEETGYTASSIELLGPLYPDTGRLANRIWGCFAACVKPAPGRSPEEGIELLTYPLPELWRATADGEFALALHVAILMSAVLRRKLPLP